MRRALLCLALAASPALGQGPAPPPTPVARIVAPASVPAGTPIVVYSTGSLSSKPLKFKLSSPAVPFDVYAKADNSETACIVRGEVTAAHPGPYQFVSIAAGGDDFDFAFATVPVVPQGPTPPPSPPPNPGPAPAPPPAPDVDPKPAAYSGPLVVTFVYDPAAMTPRLASLKDSIAIPAAIQGLDARYMTLATTAGGLPSAEYARRGLAPFVEQAGGPPAVVFQSPDGKVIRKIKAPADESGVVAAARQLRGKD